MAAFIMYPILLLLCSPFVYKTNALKTDIMVNSSCEEVYPGEFTPIATSRSKRYVQLPEKETNIPYQACVLPDGKPGHCRLLRHCMQNEFKQDFTKLMDHLCIINHSSVGVCCADEEGPHKSGVAGDLPATASHGETDAESLFSSDSRGCGVSTRAGEFMGAARSAKPRDWPWMAYVTYTGMIQHCGGALISERHVLTAAHCTDKYEANELFVRLGEYDTDRVDDSRSYDFSVVEKTQHELFDSSNYFNDICILKTHRPAVFNTYVWPICLPPPELELENQTVIVTGWGSQWYGGPHSSVLLEVPLSVWKHENCVDGFAEHIFDQNLCAGDNAGGKDACQGDSGGPLMYQMPSGRWVLVGIVSWGMRCGDPTHPGVYTKVEDYLAWIVQKVQL